MYKVIVQAGEKCLKIGVPMTDTETMEHFLPKNNTSKARDILIEFLSNGQLGRAPDWSENTVQQELVIKIPQLNIGYTLLPEVVELSQEKIQEEEMELVPSQEMELVPSQEPHQLEVNMEINNQAQEKKKGIRWTYNNTLKLIHEWSKLRQRFANNTERNEELWEELANRIQCDGFAINGVQCENKFKYLKRIYMETKDHNKKSTGEPQKSCPFYEDLNELFSKSPQVCPIVTSNRDPPPCPSSIINTENAPEDHGPPPESENITGPPAKKTRLEKSLQKWVEESQKQSEAREAMRQKRHEEAMNMQRETNNLYREFMSKLLEKM